MSIKTETAVSAASAVPAMPGASAASAHGAVDHAEIVRRYLNVWSLPDAASRRAGIAALWSADGVEFIEGQRFRGHAELEARVAEAYEAFVGSGTYEVCFADDVTVHQDVVRFTIQLADAGAVAWAARVFLVLDEKGFIQQDYHVTVQPLPAA